MKKTIIASVVGGIIIFIWQFLSWAALNLHQASNAYTPNHAAIMAALEANLPNEGGYYLPGVPENASREEQEKLMTESNGKPWASIQYHKSLDATPAKMVQNMLRALVINILTIWLFCWILGKMNMAGFTTILTASLFTGLIVFFNAAYLGSIWYQWFDIMAHFTDAMVSWGACGLWLGWYLKK